PVEVRVFSTAPLKKFCSSKSCKLTGRPSAWLGAPQSDEGVETSSVEVRHVPQLTRSRVADRAFSLFFPFLTCLPPRLRSLTVRVAVERTKPTLANNTNGAQRRPSPFHRPRTIAEAAENLARPAKDGSGWIFVVLGS